jgi:hypothetical protein
LSFHIFGKVLIVLNTFEATQDLLEKRGDICSDRPDIPFVEMYAFFFLIKCSGLLLSDLA